MALAFPPFEPGTLWQRTIESKYDPHLILLGCRQVGLTHLPKHVEGYFL